MTPGATGSPDRPGPTGPSGRAGVAGPEGGRVPAGPERASGAGVASTSPGSGDRTDFVLIHGAWHRGRCWGPLVDELERHGYRTVAVDLPADRPGLGAEEYASAVDAAVEAELGPAVGRRVVLVGHSLGGLTAPVVAQRWGPERLAALVLVAPVLPVPGTSVADRDRAGRGVMVEGFGRGQHRRPDRTTAWAPEPATNELYSGVADDLGASGPARVAAAVADMRPQAWSVNREVTPLRAWPAVPTTVVVCRRDRVVDPGRLRTVAATVPVATLVELDTGHFPMLTAPAALATALLAAVPPARPRP